MGLSYEDAVKCGIAHLWPKSGDKAAGVVIPDGKPKRTAVSADGMNKTERRFANRLEQYRHDGRIRDFKFEPEKLRLAGRTFYTPDFRVVLNDGSIEFHEVKGFLRDDAACKIKVAACLHPYIFRLVYWVNKSWEWHTVGRNGIGPAELWEP